MNTLEMTLRGGPFVFDMMGGPDDGEAMMAVEHLAHIVDRLLQEPKRRRKPESEPEDKTPS
jgi:hypothetical protein